MRRGYAAPEAWYVAEFARPWRRAAAAAIDWMLCYVAYLFASIPLGMVQIVADASWREGDLGGVPGHVVSVATQALTLAPVVAYFAFLLPTSQTFGMRAVDVHLVRLGTGRGPSFAAALLRGLVATALAASVYLLVNVWTAITPVGDLDTGSRVALAVAYPLGAVAALSALVLLVPPAHRSGVDRVFGTAVVDQLRGGTVRPSPWGPLEEFDLAHRRGSKPRRRRRFGLA